MPRARPPGPLFALPKGLVFNDPLLRRWNTLFAARGKSDTARTAQVVRPGGRAGPREKTGHRR